MSKEQKENMSDQNPQLINYKLDQVKFNIEEIKDSIKQLASKKYVDSAIENLETKIDGKYKNSSDIVQKAVQWALQALTVAALGFLIVNN